MDDKATPTITLAELYENQNQHIDALVIYKNLFKENPTDELKNKIDELKIKIFQNNTLEYSSIINKIFSEEEKRNFHILPHEQFKTYIDSQENLGNEETYPEDMNVAVEEEVVTDELDNKLEEKAIGIFPEDTIETPTIETKNETEEPAQTEEISSTSEIDDINKSPKIIQGEETIETLEIDDSKESQEPIQNEETFETPEINEAKESEIPIPSEETFKVPEIDDTTEPKEPILTEEISEIPIEENNSMEDDLTLETDDEILLEPGNRENLLELDTEKEEETISIEDIIEKNKKLEEKEDVIEDVILATVDQPAENENIIAAIVEPDTENKILNLFTKLSHIRPDIVERVLKENVGFDTPLADIKLSDLNYVVELLSISENVEKTQ